MTGTVSLGARPVKSRPGRSVRATDRGSQVYSAIRPEAVKGCAHGAIGFYGLSWLRAVSMLDGTGGPDRIILDRVKSQAHRD